jgi:hypothetical protein
LSTQTSGGDARPELGWELYGVCGPQRRTAQQLYALPTQVVARHLYLLLLQGADHGLVYVFRREGSDPSLATVMAASVHDLGELPRRLLGVLSDIPAELAPEAVLSILQASYSLSPKSDGPARAPVTPRGAFGLPLVELDEAGVVRACVVAV